MMKYQKPLLGFFSSIMANPNIDNGYTIVATPGLRIVAIIMIKYTINSKLDENIY